MKLNHILTTLSFLSASLISTNVFADSGLKPVNKAALQAVVDKAAKEMLVPGAFVLLRVPEGEFAIGYGTTKQDDFSAPTMNTHFRIASNTKTMTAAVIMKQVGEGKLKLSDPISKFVPDVPNGKNITVAELLEMRSGLYNYTSAPELAKTLDDHPKKTWSPKEGLAIAFKREPNFSPGTAYEYSNTNYALLGLVAEKIDHKPLSTIFHDRLFKVLKMQDTLLPNPKSNKIPTPFSHGYQYGESVYALIDKPYPPEFQKSVNEGKTKPLDYTFQNPSYALAAGGAISSAHDLATWIEALVSGNVFDGSIQSTWMNSLKPEDPKQPNGQHYGYGISQLRFGSNKVYFHGGEMPGYNSFMGHDPVNKMTLVVWTNLDLAIDGQLTANTLMLKILDQIYVESPLK